MYTHCGLSEKLTQVAILNGTPTDHFKEGVCILFPGSMGTYSGGHKIWKTVVTSTLWRFGRVDGLRHGEREALGYHICLIGRAVKLLTSLKNVYCSN